MGYCHLKQQLKKSSPWGFVAEGRAPANIRFSLYEWKGHVTWSLSSETPEPSSPDLSEPGVPTPGGLRCQKLPSPPERPRFLWREGTGFFGGQLWAARVWLGLPDVTQSRWG